MGASDGRFSVCHCWQAFLSSLRRSLGFCTLDRGIRAHDRMRNGLLKKLQGMVLSPEGLYSRVLDIRIHDWRRNSRSKEIQEMVLCPGDLYFRALERHGTRLEALSIYHH